MKYVLYKTLQTAAKSKPAGYLQECLQVGMRDGDVVVFDEEAFAGLVAKYAKYAVSEADPYRSRISGCCDRADQY